MQETEVCSFCQSEFDTCASIPIKLPCNHSVCQTCLFVEYKKSKQNKCPQCQAISTNNPNSLPKNQLLLNKLEQQEKQKSETENQIKYLKDSREALRQLIQRINNHQSFIVNELLRSVIEFLFSSSNQCQIKLSHVLAIINQQINIYEQLIQNNNITSSKNFDRNEQDQCSSQIMESLNLGNQEIEKLYNLQQKFYTLMEEIFQIPS